MELVIKYISLKLKEEVHMGHLQIDLDGRIIAKGILEKQGTEIKMLQSRILLF
jgi:hypothetical protein